MMTTVKRGLAQQHDKKKSTGAEGRRKSKDRGVSGDNHGAPAAKNKNAVLEAGKA